MSISGFASQLPAKEPIRFWCFVRFEKESKIPISTRVFTVLRMEQSPEPKIEIRQEDDDRIEIGQGDIFKKMTFHTTALMKSIKMKMVETKWSKKQGTSPGDQEIAEQEVFLE
ncbi:hypothetical protein CHS0354_001364 [Potamilus streckersoni]|uniref:Uncharacterized protein n=1 Tax=Potamilus streckersoni TaxID=2493646 RepID=A0AAE0WBR9_9BIVA|nr:hypothetical protein CHS0354_001364 [Potamilus streckersoni]